MLIIPIYYQEKFITHYLAYYKTYATIGITHYAAITNMFRLLEDNKEL